MVKQLKIMEQKINIQDYTPYHKSLKWEIHHNYFQKRGASAWRKGEVPFKVTSNPQGAYQNAELFFETIDSSALKNEPVLVVLEIGSGLGAFAVNFIQAFSNICEEKSRDYHNKLHYMFTDYSEKNLLDISTDKHLSELKAKGILDFYILDALNPSEVKKLDGTPFEMKRGSLAFVIANYVHCTLPVKIIRKKNESFYEKYIQLFFKTTEEQAPTLNIQELIDNPVEVAVLENLEEINQYKEIDLTEFIENKIEKESLTECLKDYDVATAIFPYGVLQSINGTLPFLKEEGLMIISDLGNPNYDYMKGEKECSPGIYGNCFAHKVNFPYLETYLNNSGLGTARTSDANYTLQTLILSKSKINEKVANTFKKLFIDSNFNEEANLNFKTGKSLFDSGDYEKAMEYFYASLNKSGEKNPCASYYHICLCQFKLKLYKEAYDSYKKSLLLDPEYDDGNSGNKKFENAIFKYWAENELKK